MAMIALILAFAALAGVVLGWVVGARSHRAMSARTTRPRGFVAALLVWPFARDPNADPSDANVATMNKALVAIIACAMLAAAAGAVAANLHRIGA